MEQIRDNEDFKEAVMKVKSGQKRAEKVKRVIFKGHGSLDALFFKVLGETQCVLDSSHVRVPYGPDETNQRQWGFQSSLQECQKRPKKGKKVKRVIFKGVVVLTHFFHGYGRASSCSRLIACQGNLWNQSETMRTSKDPSGISKMAKNGQKGDLKKNTEVLVHFS